jgi:hypothetical protein
MLRCRVKAVSKGAELVSVRGLEATYYTGVTAHQMTGLVAPMRPRTFKRPIRSTCIDWVLEHGIGQVSKCDIRIARSSFPIPR